MSEAHKIVERQRELVTKLKADGHHTADAQRTLDPFEQTLANLEEHQAALEGLHR